MNPTIVLVHGAFAPGPDETAKMILEAAEGGLP